MRKRQSPHRTFEALENRALLTSNVVANVDINGNLTVTGMGGSDHVFMQATKNNTWQIQGVKTKINGKSNIAIENVTGNITVDLGDGKNLLEIQGSTISGNLSITTGNQQDQVDIWDSTIHGALTYSGGGGNDNLWISRVTDDTAAPLSSIDMGDGNDSVSFDRFSVSNLTVNLGAGKDSLKITDSQFVGGSTEQLTVLAGTGRDSVSLTKVQTSDLTVDMGDASVVGTSSGNRDRLATTQVTATNAILWDSFGIKGSISGSKDIIAHQTIDLVGFSSRSGDLKNNK